MCVGEQVRERCEHAGNVLVRHEERGIHARDVDADAVDAADAHLAAAELSPRTCAVAPVSSTISMSTVLGWMERRRP